MTKPKKCKCGCGSEIPNNWRSPFLNKDCKNKYDRSTPKRIELAEAKKQKQLEKTWKQKEKDYEKKKKDLEFQRIILSGDKKKIKELKDDLIDYTEKLQKKVNLIARLIDKGLPCLARKNFGQMHGGHIYAVGGNKYMRFNLHNIHRQNAQSNHFQNEDGLLKEGLQNEYGMEYFNFISELRRMPPLKLTNKQKQVLADKASKIALKLEKVNKEYSLKERIELRNQINIELGIYSEEFSLFEINLK
jgi:hypothetical protein